MGVTSNAAPWVDFSVPTLCDRRAPKVSPLPSIVHYLLVSSLPSHVQACAGPAVAGRAPYRAGVVGPARSLHDAAFQAGFSACAHSLGIAVRLVLFWFVDRICENRGSTFIFVNASHRCFGFGNWRLPATLLLGICESERKPMSGISSRPFLAQTTCDPFLRVGILGRRWHPGFDCCALSSTTRLVSKSLWRD